MLLHKLFLLESPRKRCKNSKGNCERSWTWKIGNINYLYYELLTTIKI